MTGEYLAKGICVVCTHQPELHAHDPVFRPPHDAVDWVATIEPALVQEDDYPGAEWRERIRADRDSAKAEVAAGALVFLPIRGDERD